MSHSTEPEPVEEPAAKPPRGKLRRALGLLGRWTKRIAIAGAVLVLVARVTLGLWLPPLVQRAVDPMDLHVSWDDLDLSILGLSVDLVGVRVVALPVDRTTLEDVGAFAAGQTPLARLDDLGLDADVSALLTGDLRVHRLEVGGLEAWIERDSTGRWNFERHLPKGTPESGAEEDQDEDVSTETDAAADGGLPSRSIDFSSPVEVATVDLHGVRLHLNDQGIEPPLETVLDLAFSARDIGHGTRPVSLRLTAHADDVLDNLMVEGEGNLGVATLGFEAELRCDGVGVQTLGPYLEPMGIRPEANKLNARILAHGDLAPAPGGDAAPEDQVTDLGGTLALDAVTLDADGQEALSLDALVVNVTEARSSAFDIESAVLKSLQGRAKRLPDGTLRMAGLDFVGAPETNDAEPPEEDEEPDDADAPPAESRSLRLGRLAIERVGFEWVDETFTEAAELKLEAKAWATGLVLDPAHPGEPLELSVNAQVEGAGSLGVSGRVVPTGPKLEAALDLSGSSLTLGSLAPYLEAMGLESTLEDGSLDGAIQLTMAEDPGPSAADADVTRRTSASITGLALTDGNARHLEFESIVLGELAATEGGGSLIDRLALTGASIPVRVYPGGGFRGLGVQTLGLPENAEGRSVGLLNAALEATDLAFGGEGSTGNLRGTLALEGLATEVRLDGSLRTRPGPLDLDASLRLGAEGLGIEGFRDVLLASGIEPDLVDGALALQAEVSARAEGDETVVQGRLFDVALKSRGEDAFSVGEARVEELRSGPAGTTIAGVFLTEARMPVARDGEGVLSLLGLRLGAPKAPAGDSPAGGAEEESAETVAGATVIQKIRIEGLGIQWSDAMVEPAVATELTAQLDVSDLSIGPLDETPTTTTARLELQLEGAMDSAVLDASASLGTGRSSVIGTFTLEGLRAGPLTSYLPENTIVLLEDGRFSSSLQATFEPAATGGTAVRAELTELDFRDGTGGDALLAFDSALFDAPRLDPAAGYFDIGEVSLAGLMFDAKRTSMTRVDALGLGLESPAPPEEGADLDRPGPAPEVETDTTEAQGATEAAPSDAPPAPVPTVLVGKLDLGIERLRYIDLTRTDAEPLDLSLAIVTKGPQILVQPDPADLPGFELSAVGAASPMIGSIDLTVNLEPFAADPGVSLDLLLGQISGEALTRISPEVASTVDLTAYRDGSFHAAADARVSVARRGPMDFDLGRGFGAVLSIDAFDLRPTPDAEPTGFERLDVDVRRVSPETGDVRITSIDLNGIRARATQTAEGMRVAGLLFPKEEASDETLTEEAIEEPFEEPSDREAVDPSADPPGEAVAEGPPAPEVTIDRLTVSGVDIIFRDETVTPEFLFPIEDLSLEVQRFTTRTLTEPRPFSFRGVVDAGEIELAERTGSDNLLLGVLGSAASAVTMADNEFETEMRRVWDLLEVSGRLSLGPDPRGRLQTTLLGLELPAFRGPASAGGVEIGDGLLDNRTALRFREDGGLSVDSKTTATYLSLSEPPDGPITKYLSLPAPLDTVLFLLRNEDGEQNLPVRLDVPDDGVSGSQIAGLVANTLGLLITEAVSAAPLRVLGPLGDVAGALGLTREPLTAETVTLEFAEGAATMAASKVVATEDESDLTDEVVTVAGDPLAAVVSALKGNPNLRVVLQAQLGQRDLEVARRLANPDAESVEALIGLYRDRKATLERERAAAAARARAQLVTGATESADGLNAKLQAFDAERARLEAALDDLFALIRPGAERRADLRTRNAALALADERQERVRRYLVDRVGEAVATRIDARRARFRKSTEKDPLPVLGRVTVTPK